MNPDSDGAAPPALPRAAVAATLFLCLLFGGDQVSRKIVLLSIPPLTNGALAHGLAALAIGAYSLARGIPLLPRSRRMVSWHLLSGVLTTVLNGLLLVGLRLSTAGRGNVFFYAYPLFVTLLASTVARPREPLGPGRIAGSALAVSGLAVVFLDRLRSGGAVLGDSLILAGSFLLSLQILHVRRITREEHPVAAIFWQLILSALMFLLAALVFEAPLRLSALPSVWAWFAYQSLGSIALGFVVRAELVRRHGASLIASFFFLTPIVGVLLSALLLRERLGVHMLIGAPLVALGVLLVQRPSSARPG